MKYNTVIVGGGLSGLVCGIALAKNGQRVAIVSSGQSTLHFNGGSMELLGMADGKTVDDPINAIASLPETHPYYKIGADNITALANEAQRLLADAGLKMNGSAKRRRQKTSLEKKHPSTMLSSTVSGAVPFSHRFAQLRNAVTAVAAIIASAMKKPKRYIVIPARSSVTALSHNCISDDSLSPVFFRNSCCEIEYIIQSTLRRAALPFIFFFSENHFG